MKPPKKESALMLKAFEYYYKLGTERSLAKVQRKFSKSVTAVAMWSKAFKWPERCNEMDRKVSQKSLDNYDEMLVEAKRENFHIIRKAKKHLLAEIERIEKKAETFTVTLTDFERLAKLELLMLGDPTERISDDTITGLVKRAAEIRRRHSNPTKRD